MDADTFLEIIVHCGCLPSLRQHSLSRSSPPTAIVDHVNEEGELRLVVETVMDKL